MDTRTQQLVFLDRETSRDLGTEPCPLYVVYVRREGWIMGFFTRCICIYTCMYMYTKVKSVLAYDTYVYT